jgi:L-histidine Nalpha-methyltransferase
MHLLRQNRVSVSPIAEDVFGGLSATPKTLPPRLFYDEAGSELFEQITRLPEYYLTRTEQGIFEKHSLEILEKAGDGLTLIELGAGTAAKTQVLIKALLKRQLRAKFYPIDVSESALQIAQQTLSERFPALSVVPLVGDYSEGLSHLSRLPGRKLVLYIGSSIGNFEPEDASRLLHTVRRSLSHGDALLLGTDMVKDADVLRRAYNDSQGVTADFNLNLLARINRELGGQFDIETFRHVAEWNARELRIEMYLESELEQDVEVGELGAVFHFAEGERIHTENSYKFTPQRVERILSAGGFVLEKTWTDDKGRFGVHLARVE